MKWASAVNEMGTERRPIICQVMALCSQQGVVVCGRAVCRKGVCIN